MKNKRIILCSFAVLLAVGVGLGIFLHQKEKARQQKIAWFQINLVLSQAAIQASADETKQILQATAKVASDNDEGDAFISTALGRIDLSDLKKKANTASDYVEKADQKFTDIYTSYNIPESLKTDFLDYKQIIEKNSIFVDTMSSGQLSPDSLKEWMDDGNKETELYQNINLEVEKLKK